MKDESISIQDVLTLIKRNLYLYILWVTTATAIAVLLVVYLPKKYKSTGQLNIQSSYFQNPLVNDLISEVHDPSERISQRLALLRLALTDEFVDSLGERYQVYQYPAEHSMRVVERELFRKKIEFFSVNRNAFQVSTISSTAQSAYKMTLDVINQMMDTAISVRNKTLIQTRDALQDSLNTLGSALEGVTGPLASFQQSLQKEQQEVRANIRALKSQYTEEHPDILKLKKREQSISILLKQSHQATRSKKIGSSKDLINPDAKESTQDVYNELLKKLSYLHIAIELNKDKNSVSYLSLIQKPSIPTQAFFPRLDVFCLVGFVVGNIIALITIILTEMHRGNFLSPHIAAEHLQTEFLGSIPKFSNKQLSLIEHVSQKAVPLSLNI